MGVLAWRPTAANPGPFQQGLRSYVAAYAYGVVTTAQLWAGLQAVPGVTLNVSGFMTTWTSQAGYPVVTVHINGDGYGARARSVGRVDAAMARHR